MPSAAELRKAMDAVNAQVVALEEQLMEAVDREAKLRVAPAWKGPVQQCCKCCQQAKMKCMVGGLAPQSMKWVQAVVDGHVGPSQWGMINLCSWRWSQRTEQR